MVYFEVTLGYFVVTLGYFEATLGYFEVTLRLLWGYFECILGYLGLLWVSIHDDRVYQKLSFFHRNTTRNVGLL